MILEETMWRVFLMATLLLGMVGTVSATTIYDDFEDGDISEYKGDTSYYNANSTKPFHGTYSLWSEYGGGVNTFITSGNLPGGNFSRNGEPIIFNVKAKKGGETLNIRFYSDTDLDKDDRGYRILFNQYAGNFRLDKLPNFQKLAQKSQSYDLNEWYRIEFIPYSNGTLVANLYDNKGNRVNHLSAKDSDYSSGGLGIQTNDQDDSGKAVYQIDYLSGKRNAAPSINSVSTDPQSWTNGSNIDVSANVSDPDGQSDISSVTADVWENGTQIVNDASLTDGDGDGVYNASNVFKVDTIDVYYNLTVNATDSKGATDSENKSQLIEQLPPKIAHLEPENNSQVFDYQNDYKIRIRDDGDNVKAENITCDIYNQTQQLRTVSALENESQEERTFTGLLERPAGQNKFKTSCVDGSTTNTSTFYTIDRFDLKANSSLSDVYETANVSYNSSWRVGDMVDELNVSLYWNDTLRSWSEVTGTGVRWHNLTQFFRPELVTQNDTTTQWHVEARANFTELNGNRSNATQAGADNSQDIWLAYFVDNMSIAEDRQVEALDLHAGFRNYTVLSSVPGPVSTNSSITYNGTKKAGNKSVFRAYVIPGSNRTLTTNTSATGSYKVEHLGSSKILTTSKDNVKIHDKRLTDCGGSISSTVALKWHVREEENRTKKVKANIDFNLNTTDIGRNTVNFAFETEGSDVNTCIYPSWADYRVTGPVVYQADNYTKRFYDLFNVTIDNSTEEFYLYLLNEDKAAQVFFKVENTDDRTISGATINVMRYFPGQDAYKTVEKTVTDSEGIAPARLRVNDIYYKYIVSKNGKVLKSTTRSILTCASLPCKKTFVVEPGISDYFEAERGFSWDCFKNTDPDGVQCTVYHEETMEQATLQVERKGIGRTTTTVCNVSVQSSGESLVCSGLNFTDHVYQYSLTGSKDGNIYTLETGVIDQTKGVLTGSGSGSLFFAFLLFGTITMLGIWDRTVAILSSVAGVLVPAWIGLYTLSIGSMAGATIIGIMAAGEARRR